MLLDLLDDIEAALDTVAQPGLHPSTQMSDLFEVWIYCLILTAARDEGFAVSVVDVGGTPQTTLSFRSSPGWVYGAHSYCHAVISHDGMVDMELHHGVFVDGMSGKPHECDVALLRSGACIASRAAHANPPHTGLVLGAECKFYTNALKLGLLREFIGLALELGRGSMWFTTNATHHALHPMLRRHKLHWEDELEPGGEPTDRLLHSIRTTLDHLKG